MTQVSWRNQLILAAALFGLGLLAYWAEYKHKPTEEAKQEQAKKIFALKDVQIQKIRLGDSTRAFEVDCDDIGVKLCRPGDNSKWELASPIQSRADDGNANALVSTLNNLSSTDTIDLKDETPEKRAALLKEYGLDPESRSAAKARTVEVTTAIGTRILHLGGTHPIGEGIFSVVETTAPSAKTGQVDDTKVFLIPSFFKANFEHDLTYWRNKKILNLSAHTIDSFQLESPKTHVVGTKKDGQWTIRDSKSKNSAEMAGDLENIDSLLTTVGQISAKEFVGESKNDAKAKAVLKSAKPLLKITLQQEKGQDKAAPAPVTVSIFVKALPKKPEPPKPDRRKPAPPTSELYATVSGMDQLFQIDASAQDRLNKELKDLRQTKLITSMERFSARKLQFNGAAVGGAVELQYLDGKWKKGAEEAPTEKIQSMLDRLSGNRVKDYLKGSSIPKGENEGLEFSLTDDKGVTKRQYLFWKNQGTLYARDLTAKQKEKEAMVIDSQVTDALPWSPDFFKPAPPAAPVKGSH